MADIESSKTRLQESSTKLKTTINEKDAESKQLEKQLEEISAEHLANQESLASVREKIAQAKSTVSLNEARLQDVLGRRESLELQLSKSEERSTEFQKRIESANADPVSYTHLTLPTIYSV